MDNNKDKVINDFIADEINLENQKIIENNKKLIKSDNSIIERIDKIIIAENGKQLLRERY